MLIFSGMIILLEEDVLKNREDSEFSNARPRDHERSMNCPLGFVPPSPIDDHFEAETCRSKVRGGHLEVSGHNPQNSLTV